MIECAWGASKTQNCFFSKYSYTQTVVRKKCHESKSGYCTQNVNSHLACVVRGNHIPIIRSLIQRATQYTAYGKVSIFVAALTRPAN